MSLHKCPECGEMSLKTHHDDESNGGCDSFECTNPECEWRG